MYMVRLRSIDGVFNFKVFTSRPLVLSSFKSGQNQVIDEDLIETALFDNASANDPRTAIRLVRDGGAALSGIFPQPMTEAQAAAWLADLYL
jgi:hypothetical protein